MASPFTLRWGIMATGGIAQTFCKDMLTKPATRQASGITHDIVAVASSRSRDSAVSFIDKIKGPSSAKLYGSYKELVADPNVDIIYVATPHSHHFQNVMLCFEAGKNVLCEKALTVTAAQTKKLVETARAKNLFFMEAVWTRYFPASIKIREMIEAKELGEIYRTFADFSMGEALPNGDLNYPDENRMVNIDLAGGALLDLGIYSLTWVFQTLYHTQKGEKETPVVSSSVNKYKTGADEMTSVVVSFPKHKSMGIATTTMRTATNPDDGTGAGPSIRVQCANGEIQLFGPACKPKSYKVIKKGGGDVEMVQCIYPTDADRDGWGHGMYWEADECAYCIRDGKKESSTLPLDESVVIMEVMDKVIQDNAIKYPDLITTDVYDANSPLNTGNQ